jgi:hypothetical protein
MILEIAFRNATSRDFLRSQYLRIFYRYLLYTKLEYPSKPILQIHTVAGDAPATYNLAHSCQKAMQVKHQKSFRAQLALQCHIIWRQRNMVGGRITITNGLYGCFA